MMIIIMKSGRSYGTTKATKNYGSNKIEDMKIHGIQFTREERGCIGLWSIDCSFTITKGKTKQSQMDLDEAMCYCEYLKILFLLSTE